MPRSLSYKNTCKASSQSRPLTSRRTARPNSLEHNMVQDLAAQYLERIGYVSGAEQAVPEPDLKSKSSIKLAAKEEVQPKNLKQLRMRHAPQGQAYSTISSRPAAQTRTPDLRQEPLSQSILSENPSTSSSPGTEASHQFLKSRHKPKSPLAPPPPPSRTKAQILAGLHSELERRQKMSVEIEHQIDACQNEIQALPSKQKKVAQEHEKRITELTKLEPAARQTKLATEKQRDTQTAEEAQIEEMRSIYLQYERESTGVPTAESVDALFAIIADTEHHVQKAEEANKVAKRREAKLEEKLYKARCAMFEMEREIEEVENGGKEARELKIEGDCRIGGDKEGKKKRRRGKGFRDRRQRKGHSGDR